MNMKVSGDGFVAIETENKSRTVSTLLGIVMLGVGVYMEFGVSGLLILAGIMLVVHGEAK